ncbi:MAG: ribosome silencing factor [Bacillota bacterium]|nr:MAG: ribosome silencing factor [Bacillota bacterium]
MEVSRDLALVATQAAEERKAGDVLLLDLRGLTLVADYFLIASGETGRQVKAIAEHIVDSVTRSGLRLLHREGIERWVLLDFGGLVCHVFNRADRQFYGLERFWGDAPRIWPPPAGGETAGRHAG